MAGALWAMLLREAALPAHLGALKDYFLLGAGDFYQAFLTEVPHAISPRSHEGPFLPVCTISARSECVGRYLVRMEIDLVCAVFEREHIGQNPISHILKSRFPLYTH